MPRIDDYKQAIALDAESGRGASRLRTRLPVDGQRGRSRGHYDAAVQLAPNDAYAAACRADLLTDVGRYSDALAEYERAIANRSEVEPGTLRFGVAARDLPGQLHFAIRAWRSSEPELRSNEGGEQDAVNFDSLAAAQASAGDFEAAMDSVRKAIELAPADERDAYKERLVMYQTGQAVSHRAGRAHGPTSQLRNNRAGRGSLAR